MAQGTAPGLRVVEPEHDFGRLRPGAKVSHVFRMTNGGRSVVNLLDLRPECGCLTAAASRSRLAPGESAEIRVTFQPDPQEGPVVKAVEVVTDAAPPVRLQLILKSLVAADLGLSANHVAFEGVSRQGGGLAEVRLEDRHGVAVQVDSLETSAPGFLTVTPVRDGRDVVLRLRLDGSKLPALAARGEAWVMVQASNPEPAAFRIQVLWTAPIQ